MWVVSHATKDGNETGTSFKQALYFKGIGFNLLDTMIYLKTSTCAIGGNATYASAFEYMFVFSKGIPETRNILRDRKNMYPRIKNAIGRRNRDGKHARKRQHIIGEYTRRINVWAYNIGGGNSSKDLIAFDHPAIFPVDLAHDHIVSWSNEGDLVLDPMCGSGTTCKMAKLSNRNYIGMDISQEVY